jgi:hypothetical protein
MEVRAISVVYKVDGHYTVNYNVLNRTAECRYCYSNKCKHVEAVMDNNVTKLVD